MDLIESLAALDEREFLYERHSVEADNLTSLDSGFDGSAMPYFVYAAQPLEAASAQPKILRSYLDAVAQGYLSAFGREGLRHFKATTRNGHFSIYEDRSMPLYPRSINLNQDERAAIDAAFPSQP
ncbi:hypothetical protein ACFQ14_16510 [Pseudahrensia aquimaris]|uniref:Uncharacterized protein n=1 Tax=Pseudahrensia aquimaris TaxID=744461 RepID=A0ABW3FK20_9HYPH